MKKITGYGNFLWKNIQPSNAVRHTLYQKYNFRCVISPQYYMPRLRLPLALHGYALDNGAYINYNKGLDFDVETFFEMVKDWGDGADWIAIPDVVTDASTTLNVSWPYISKLTELGFGDKLLFVYQDGMTAADLHPYVGQKIGIFIGGTTEAKLKNLPWIAELCRLNDVVCHVGRVNTMKRVNYCIDHGCTSFDGSGWTQFPVSFSLIEQIENNTQMSFFEYDKKTNHLVALEQRASALGLTVEDVEQYRTSIKDVDISKHIPLVTKRKSK